MVYVLELATILTLRDRETLETLGEGLSISLQSFIRDARNIHPLSLSRIVYYLLELLRLSHVCFLPRSAKLADNPPGSIFHARSCHPS